MKPVKPKFKDTVKLEVQVSHKAKEILSQYARYTKYTESEIIDLITAEILDDDTEFVEWLKKRRYKKKIDSLIFNSSPASGDKPPMKETSDEEVAKDCPFN